MDFKDPSSSISNLTNWSQFCGFLPVFRCNRLRQFGFPCVELPEHDELKVASLFCYTNTSENEFTIKLCCEVPGWFGKCVVAFDGVTHWWLQLRLQPFELLVVVKRSASVWTILKRKTGSRDYAWPRKTCIKWNSFEIN